MSPSRYHPVLVSLHWLLAFLIVFSLLLGTFSLKEIPNSSPDKIFALRGHMILGILILLLMIVRFVMRFRMERPQPATAGNVFLDRIALATHYGLYLVVILMAASGIAIATQAGLPGIVFGGSGAPLPESFAVFTPRVAHGVISRLLLVLGALHVLAAIYHQFIRRDRLLSRMWFGKR